MKLPKVIVIIGPTASGKTALAIKLAKKINGEIVSADSRQIYRGMDIGTAKSPILPAIRLKRRAVAKSSAPSNDGVPYPVVFQGIPHYLIDVKNPNQSYTLSHFKKDALQAIRKIIKKGKLPFLVGGTGLYLSTIINNLEIPAVKPNKKLRQTLEKLAWRKGLDWLYQKLLKLDPEAACIVDPKNPRRIIRALEIALATKKPFSAQRKKGPKLFDFLVLGIALPEAKLKSRISSRADKMVKQGLVREVKSLIKKYSFRCAPFNAIGYREIIDYLKGKASLKEALKLMNRNSWQLAKHQMTWFKKMPVVWIKNQQQAGKEIKKFLK